VKRKQLINIIEIATAALTVAAIVQEMAKPKSQRVWHGKIIGIIPYDFRFPTWERFREAYWNPYDRHILTSRVFGVGWTINFYALLENLGLVRVPGGSEEDFLMPNKSLRQVLKQGKTVS
jgi:hypothetical protein